MQLSVHYENNSPFLVVTRLERTLELSMWGNIAVEEVKMFPRATMQD